VPQKAQDDDLEIALFEIAMERPSGERLNYIREACRGDDELVEAVWRRHGQGDGRFLLAPVCPPAGGSRSNLAS
jgi:hypothetical protein